MPSFLFIIKVSIIFLSNNLIPFERLKLIIIIKLFTQFIKKIIKILKNYFKSY